MLFAKHSVIRIIRILIFYVLLLFCLFVGQPCQIQADTVSELRIPRWFLHGEIAAAPLGLVPHDVTPRKRVPVEYLNEVKTQSENGNLGPLEFLRFKQDHGGHF